MSRPKLLLNLLALLLFSLVSGTSAAAATLCTPWSSSSTYTKGMTASVGTVNYTANWWTLNENPTTHNGGPGSGQPWTVGGSCDNGCNVALSAPTGLAASSTTSTGTTLTWTASNAPAGCVTYTVFKNGASLGTATSPTFVVTGLSPGTTYQFTVSAVDTLGASPQSAPLPVTTLPACTAVPSAPSGLASSGTTSTSTVLSWTAVTPPPNCTITGYTVFKNGAQIGTTTTTSMVIRGLAPSTTFQFTVTAADSFGSSPPSSAPLPVTTLPACSAVPSAPTGLSSSGTTSTSTTLSWTAVTPPANCTITGYTVFKNGASIGSTTATSLIVTGLAPSTAFNFAVTATDEAGSSLQSSPITVSTPKGVGLPKHLLMGYWQDFTGNGATPLTIANVPAGYTIIAVAFANATTNPGEISFTLDPGLSAALGGYTTSQFIADIAAAHSRGQKVILSVGGQNGVISVSDATSATNFVNSVHQLMTQYGFDGVDIDLENGVSPTFMGSALQQLASMSPGMVITLAPQTLDMQSTGGAYFQLALNIKSILTMVNTQYYNSGGMLGCDNMFAYTQATENFITALACIQFQGGLDPSQVGVGLPAVPGAAQSGGFQSPSAVNAAVDCLTSGTNCGTFKPPSTWPTLRGVMTWDINWDATSGFAFVNTVAPHLASLP